MSLHPNFMGLELTYELEVFSQRGPQIMVTHQDPENFETQLDLKRRTAS